MNPDCNQNLSSSSHSEQIPILSGLDDSSEALTIYSNAQLSNDLKGFPSFHTKNIFLPLLHSLFSETCPDVNAYTDITYSQTPSCDDLEYPFSTKFSISESLDNFKHSSNSHSLENYIQTLIKIHFESISHEILENPGTSYSLFTPLLFFLM